MAFAPTHAGMIEEYVASYYPGYAAFFRTIPELTWYLSAAALEGWSKEKTKAVILGTDWWKATSGPAREALNLQLTDPASWNIQVANRATLLGNEAARLGWVLPSNVAHFYAAKGFESGKTDQQLITELVLQQAPDPKGAPGVLGEMFAKAKGASGDWGVTVSDNEARLVAKGAVAYGGGDEAVSTFGRKKALDTFKGNKSLEEAINDGLTVKDFATPYMEMAAQQLELAPGAVDISNAGYQRAFHHNGPNGLGPMDLADWQTHLRTDPIFGKIHNETIGAKTEAAQMVEQLETTFGQRG